jgi:exopolysaccharide biosynthesis polyprenyl glycosylphosphotransferase
MTTSPLSLPQIFGSRSEFATVRVVVRMMNDLLLILVAFGLALASKAPIIRSYNSYLYGLGDIRSAELCILFLLFASCYLWIAYSYGLYSPTPLNRIVRELRLIVQACVTAGLALCGALYMCHMVSMSRPVLLLLDAVSALALCLHRCARPSLRSDADRTSNARTIAILGTNQFSFVMSEHLRSHPQLSYHFLGFIRFPGSHQGLGVSADSILGDLADIGNLKKKHFINDILVSEYCPDEQIIDLINRASVLGLDVRAVSGFYPQLTINAPLEFLGDFPVTSLHRTKSKAIALLFKRAADIVFTCAALPALAIPMILIALVIKLDSRGPVFYISERLGKRGRPFHCYKFRTMAPDADKFKQILMAANERDGVLFKMRRDPRVTRVGRFLRKYSIDEIPQFFNVLKGDMSLIGPRPPIPSEVERYNLEQLHRLSVPPGITGLWQVKARSDNSFERYIALDMAYVENWTPWLDMKILFRTLEVVIRGTGV